MEYYKVLIRTEEDELVSGYTLDEEWQVKYSEPEDEEWAKPRIAGSKLFVFTSLDEARHWLRTWGYGIARELWRVEAEGVEPMRQAPSLSPRRWNKYWKCPATFWGDEVLALLKHTIFADRVLLIERIGADDAAESITTT